MSSAVSDHVAHFRDFVAQTLPEGATVAVVSRGDNELLELDGREGWHFPQRADGVYAGYYPHDSAAAVSHLESLRERGAEFLAFPAVATWWLEYYDGLAEHLETKCRLVVRDEHVGAIYALDEAWEPEPARPAADLAEKEPAPAQPAGEAPAEDLAALFDAEHYAKQAGRAFPSAEQALEHYLAEGHREGLDPHPLIDADWYLSRHPEAAAAGSNPLLHFVRTCVDARPDPNPYFDTAFYYAQQPEILEARVNALAHYAAGGRRGESTPNPLFDDVYYRETYNDVELSGVTPLEHFLSRGAAERRYASNVHRNIFDRLRDSSVRGLVRGNWKRGTVILVEAGGSEPAVADTGELVRTLADEHRLDCILIRLRRSSCGADEGARKVMVLEDYELACPIFRPSALRMLALTLASLKPVAVLSEVPELLDGFSAAGVPAYGVGPADAGGDTSTRGLVERVLAHLRVEGAASVPRRTAAPAKVNMICSDWAVSGVNAALEAVGRELLRRGWDVEIVFTRDPEFVLASADGGEHMPDLPYRYLERTRGGLDGMWEALIADLQRQGPCIAFLAYDQVGNCVVPALTDEVGVVSWVQADDGDYYEQAYRLGRYCNAIVCVSSHIRDKLVALNPAVADRAHVIHNTSVSASEVVSRRPAAGEPMRLVYTGRLVQYQKRILDFVELAQALDRTGVPYEISLIGAFSAYDGTKAVFDERAGAHLADGRIRLLGRLPRQRILEELAVNDFFVLLSDFEGLPLSLVEAMATGCVPIVAESPSGIPEIVDSGRNGLMVEGRDYVDWARRLTALWQDRPRLLGLSNEARETVREHFTIEQIGGEFDRVLRAVADEVTTARYKRPPALTWGPARSPAGDVLPPPSLFVAAPFARYPGLT